jgi:serine/threonine-protein kinase RsbW
VTSEVRVTIPAQARFLRIARLTAAGVAGDAGFDLREIEDLRVAIDEMCAVVIEDAPEGVELSLTYQSRDGHLEIAGSCTQSGPPPDVHPIARELLALTADEFEVGSDGGVRTFRLVKRRTDRST